MDKYTYNLKTDKIQKLVRQGDYATAAKISDTMEWAQERNVRLLMAAAEAYEKMGKIEDATELCLRAYEHSTAGKRILYKLTELALKGDRIKDAETFYRKYLEEAEDDTNRFVLRYLIADKKDEPLQRRIDILEAYHKYEFEEQWACELAELYQQAGEQTKCVLLCDKIILYFGVGPYVERAMELKETFEPLTEEQQDRRENKAYYEEQVRRIAEEMASLEEADPTLFEENTDEQDRQSSADHMANYTASVDISMIQEIMEEDVQEPHPGEVEDPMGAVEVIPVEDAMMEDTVMEDGETQESSLEEPVEVVPAEEPFAEETPEEEAQPEAVYTQEDELEAAIRRLESSEDLPADIPAEIPTPEETVPEAPAEEAVPETEPVEAVPEDEMEEDVYQEAPEEELGTTKNLQDTPGWREVFHQDVEENTDPTKEIVIPGEFLKKAEEGELVPENAPAEPVEAAPEEILAQAQEDVPIIAMDEIEQAELEEQLNDQMGDSPAPVAIGFSHERCRFLIVEDGEDGTSKAVDELDAFYASKKLPMSPIAKISAEKLNIRGLVHSLPQLNHKDLIVVKANGLSDTILGEILEVLDYLDTDKTFVLMDTADEIDQLKLRLMEQSPAAAEAEELPSIQPEEEEKEEIRQEAPEAPAPKEMPEVDEGPEEGIDLENISESQVLSKRDFIRYADKFARELECAIDESGYDALEEEMDAILKESGKLTAGDVEDLIEDAAENAEKAGIRRMFSAKYNKEGFLILRKRNFH